VTGGREKMIAISCVIDKSKVPGYTASFSGYPGALASGDDYVLLSSGLVTMFVFL
jgi:hypothetical protein